MTSRKRASRKAQPVQIQQTQVEQQPVHLPEQWWIKNQVVLQHLHDGRSVQEIASLVGRSARQVQVVKKQLDDLHTARLSLQDILNLLRYLPHPRVERPPEVLAQFERFMQQIEREEESSGSETIGDASANLDKYIYG